MLDPLSRDLAYVCPTPYILLLGYLVCACTYSYAAITDHKALLEWLCLSAILSKIKKHRSANLSRYCTIDSRVATVYDCTYVRTRRGAAVWYINDTKLTCNKFTCKTSPTNFTCSLVGVAKRTLDTNSYTRPGQFQ